MAYNNNRKNKINSRRKYIYRKYFGWEVEMKKISYKIILFTVLIAVALSVSISSVSIITSRNLMNKATDNSFL
jgi:hypothetical protein